MKLYLEHCKICNNKIPLDVKGFTKSELRAAFSGDAFYCTCPTCNNRNIYDVNNVLAETDSSSAPGGAVLGGVVGLLGGPLGAIIGAIIGGSIGGASDGEDIRRVKTFNESF